MTSIGRQVLSHFLRARIPGGWTALLAVLVLGLALSLPGGVVHSQTAEQFFTYEENSPDPVAHFTADDPEDAMPGWWSLTAAAVDMDGDDATDGAADVTAADIADRGLFKVDQNGTLSFRTPRSYEDNSASFTSGSPAPTDKQYRVTVQYSDGLNTEYFEAYVTVTDVEEAGSMTVGLSSLGDASISVPLPETVVWQQFQPGATLQGRVTDPDNPTAGSSGITATWKWYRVDGDGNATVIPGATEREYTVVEADVGHRIKAEATYTDGKGPTETLSLTSVNPAQAYRRPLDNKHPEFPSQVCTLGGSSGQKKTCTRAVTRRVAENSSGAFGGPVTGTDPDGDILTYTVRGTDASISFGVPRFAIDNATGQLMMAPGVKLNYEADNEYEVTVRAYDSAANNDGSDTDPQVDVETTVTIHVINLDEKPTFDTGSTPAGVVMAQTEGRTEIDLDNDRTTTTDDLATFVASDPDRRDVELSLRGADAGAFMLAADTVAGAGVSQVLSFKEKTDFEMPADANMDNVYEVTVRASDGSMHADRMLIIKVINDATEMGSVKLSGDPVVGVELTASVTHMEGSVAPSGEIANLKWQWQSVDPAGAACNADTLSWPVDTMPATSGNIADATEAAYTPVSDDEGDCLRAVATYNYQFATAATTVESAGALVVVSRANQAPKFAEGPRTFRVVKEDVVAADPNDDAIADDATDNVGTPVMATDANGDTPVYTLGGAGAAFFRVRADGQLEVKAELDHETRSSHTVTLTANDGSGTGNARATITVTIYVADVDEAPKIRDSAGAGAKQYRENGTGPVARLMATDPEGARPITWSLPDAAVADTDVAAEDVADHDLFKIDQNGVLSFKTPRSYEDDSASGDKNYQVAVQASDGHNNGYHELTVTVSNVEESGEITWTVTPSGGSAIAGLQQFEPGAVLIPTVTDPDGPATITPTTWRWYRGSSVISGENGATYTVVGADVGHRIRVQATYTDDGPPGAAETVNFTSPNPVRAAKQASNTAPAFSNTTVTRRVAENSSGNVGAPVTATDADNDRLTYTLSGTDADTFSINAATGQLMVGDDVTIDYEDAGNPDQEYEVTVTATDSAGIATATPATVTISVSNVNEKPTFDTGSTAAGVIMAQTEGRTAIDLDNDTSVDTDVATFVASDPEESKVTLSLMGTDASDFELADDTDTGNGVSQVLSFKEKTDFEMPADSNRDNVYVVIVRASDRQLHTDRMLIIKVINDATESGSVSLSGDAVVGVELTATLIHDEGSVAPSGEITKLKWQWQTADSAGTPATCTDATVSWPADTDADTAGNIEDATKAMYTPVAANEGDCVRAVATYVYQFMPMDPATTAMSSGALVLSSQVGQAPNQAPKFKEGATTFRVVMEDAKPNAATDDAGTTDIDETTQGNIGMPVIATDANGETLSYALGGADASLFSINATSGQLQVKGKLDHEANPTHTVTITADDQSGESNATARITVTVYVTDVDEKPAIMLGAAPSLTISGPQAEDYPENGTGAVATYTAMGTDAASARWSLSGADMGDFRLNTQSGASVRLMFGATPDYENPTDANTDNVYMVTLTARADGRMATRDVAVTVTDVAENRAPDFGFATAVRMVAENTAADENIGAPVEAADPDNDVLTYHLGGADAAAFAIDSATGQLKTMSALDYETKSSYTVTVTARDVNGSPDDVTVTINVTNVEEEGTVTLTPTSAAVGAAVAANLTDPDGSVSSETWQWQSAATADGSYTDISGATSANYTPVDADIGMHIRATVSYTDGHGAGKSAMSSPVEVSASADPLVARYDANNNGTIEKSEVIAAINEYLAGGTDAPSKADVIRLINLYLAG